MAITVNLMLKAKHNVSYWHTKSIQTYDVPDANLIKFRWRDYDFWLKPTRKNLKKSQQLLLEERSSGYFLKMDKVAAELSKMSFWLLEDEIYIANDNDVTLDDVVALLNVAANRRKLQLEKAHTLQSMASKLESKPLRQGIPQAVRMEVWQRDRGRCVECESQEKLEFDHVIPVSMGGSNTARNIQLLCELCNRVKGASLG